MIIHNVLPEANETSFHSCSTESKIGVISQTLWQNLGETQNEKKRMNETIFGIYMFGV